MAVPTTASRGDSVSEDVAGLHQAISHARQLAVTWQTNLAAGDMAIETLLNGLYVPLAANADRGGVWRSIQAVRLLSGFHEEYLANVQLYFEFGPADVLLPGNRIAIGDNAFAIGDPVRFRQRDALPAPLLEGTTYFILDKPTLPAITLSTTPSGAEIDITSKGSGNNIIRFALNAELNALETAIEGVIDAIIAAVPTDNPTPNILSRTFDKTLASSTIGLADQVLTPAQTASIRTALATLQGSIEAPV